MASMRNEWSFQVLPFRFSRYVRRIDLFLSFAFLMLFAVVHAPDLAGASPAR